jgi:hypothetical protein
MKSSKFDKMSDPSAILGKQPTKEKEIKMTVANKTYAIGDLFTTQRSNVTGTITEIVPVTENRTRVKLSLDNGEYRWTTVTIK